MNQETIPNRPNEEEVPERSNFTESIAEIRERNKSVEKKIESRTEGVIERAEKLGNSPRVQEVRGLLETSRRRLTLLAASATFLLAMNSTAVASENTEKLSDGPRAESVSGEQTNIAKKLLSSTNLDETLQDGEDIASAVGTLVETTIEEKRGRIKNNIKILTGEDTVEGGQEEDPSKKIQKKVDAGLELATDTPIISKVIAKKIPTLTILSALNDLQTELRKPTATAMSILIKVSRLVIDAKTFGLGTIAIDTLYGLSKSSEHPKNDPSSPSVPSISPETSELSMSH